MLSVFYFTPLIFGLLAYPPRLNLLIVLNYSYSFRQHFLMSIFRGRITNILVTESFLSVNKAFFEEFQHGSPHILLHKIPSHSHS